MKYLIEFHNVPHEIALYVEEIKIYGEVVLYQERYPMYLYLESPWDKEILEEQLGVKQVREPLYRAKDTVSVIRGIMEQKGML